MPVNYFTELGKVLSILYTVLTHFGVRVKPK